MVETHEIVTIAWPVACGLVALAVFWMSKRLFPVVSSSRETGPNGSSDVAERTAKAIGVGVVAILRQDREAVNQVYSKESEALRKERQQTAASVTALANAVAVLNERVTALQKLSSPNNQPTSSRREIA